MNSTSVKARYWEKMRAYIHRATRAKTPLTMTQVQSVVQFLLQTTSPSVTCELLRNYPRILRKSAEYKLKPTVQLLQKLYGNMFYKAIEKNPSLLLVTGVGFETPQNKIRRKNRLGHDDDQDAMSVEAFLLNYLGVSTSQVDKLKDNHPKVFQLSMTNNVKPVIDFLQSLCHAGEDHPSDKMIQRIITNNPNILSLDVTFNLKPKILFLQDRCGMDDNDIKRVLGKSPGILGLSLKDKYEPMIQFLEYIFTSTRADAIHHVKEHDFRNVTNLAKSSLKSQLRQCLLRHPQLLALSIENLKTKTLYFDTIDYLSSSGIQMTSLSNDHQEKIVQQIKFNEPSLMSRIASTIPSVLSLSLQQNIIPTVSTLAHAWGSPDISRLAEQLALVGIKNITVTHTISASSLDLSQMLGEFTGVLSLSLENNIYPTLKFYNQTQYIHLDHKGHGKNPKLRARYIASSLVNCLLPRWNYYLSVPATVRGKSHRPPIHVLAGFSDAAFCKKMGFDLDDYIHYKTLSLPAFKFKSQFDNWLETGRPIETQY